MTMADYTSDLRLDAVMKHFAGVGLQEEYTARGRHVDDEWADWPEEDNTWTDQYGCRQTGRYGKRRLRIMATEVLVAIDAAVQPHSADSRAVQAIRDVASAAHRLLDETANPQDISDDGDRRNWHALNDAYAALAALVPQDEARSGGALVEYLWPAQETRAITLADAQQAIAEGGHPVPAHLTGAEDEDTLARLIRQLERAVWNSSRALAVGGDNEDEEKCRDGRRQDLVDYVTKIGADLDVDPQARPARIDLPGGWYFAQVNPPHGVIYALRTPKGRGFGINGTGMSMGLAPVRAFAVSLAQSAASSGERLTPGIARASE